MNIHINIINQEIRIPNYEMLKKIDFPNFLIFD